LEAFSIHSERKGPPIVQPDQREDERQLGTLRADFCMDFYPLSKVVDLRIKIISFQQGDNESLSSCWERFELLCKLGPDLSLQDHILLQYFYIDLN
jgi:hypothetical protein